MTDAGDPERLFDALDLKEYEATALKNLLRLGRTTAPDLAEATGIPKARIYGVLDALANAGYIEVIPERPKIYQPKPPEAVLDRAIENRRHGFEQFRQQIEDLRSTFLTEYKPLYEGATEDVTPTEELFYVVDVGEPSERETRALYDGATTKVNVLTKSFEYFDSVEPAIVDAIDRGVTMRVLFVDPDQLVPANREIQSGIIDTLVDSYPEIAFRFSHTPLPLRGTVADPSMDYETGKAIFLVEEKDIPLHMRQAAVTENGSLVAAVNRYFSLIWDHDSTGLDEIDRAR